MTKVETRNLRRLGIGAFGRRLALGIRSLLLFPVFAAGQTAPPSSIDAAHPGLFHSEEDGKLDIGSFLDKSYGFLPIIMPITEPAVGYGAAGALAFIDGRRGQAGAEFKRPNITAIGGLGTENGSWGAVAGDSRYWLDDRLQTLAGVVYSSVNLDYFGLGHDPVLSREPLRYNLEPKGGLLQAKYRIADSRLWAGLSYAFAATDISFDAPAGTPGPPSFPSESNVGGMTPSLTFDTRDNIFTPVRGTYFELGAGLFSQALGGDDEFQRIQVVAMRYFPLHPKLFLGLRGQIGTSFGTTPFYLHPFIYMRGVPLMRYQGEEIGQIEAELRWQFWTRFSLVGFVGGGAAWNNFQRFENTQTVVAGGTGFRYELSRKHGIHIGVDVAVGPADPAIYLQVGSAWVRP